MQENLFDGTDQELYFDCVDISSGTEAVRLIGSSDGEVMADATVVIKEYKVTAVPISSPSITWTQALGKWKLIRPSANVTQYGPFLVFITKSGIAPVTIEGKTVHLDTYYATAETVSAVNDRINLLQDMVSALATDSALENAQSDITTIKATTDLLTLTNIKTQAAGALTDFDTVTPIAKASDIAGISITASAGVDKVIPYGSYGINPAAKTMTFSGVYESLTIEQILFIKNLTTNYIIYDCKDRDYTALPIYKLEGDAAGIFHYTADNPGATSTDLLHISVNQVPV